MEKAVQEALDVSSKLYEAFNKGNMQDVYNLMADDVHVKAPLDYSDVESKKSFECHGKQEVESWTEKWTKCFDWEDLKCLLTFADARGSSNEGVFTFNHICYKLICKKTGKSIDCRHEADVLLIKDGKVTCFFEFSDTAEVLRICDVLISS